MIDKAALAQAVRDTTNLNDVTCTVTLDHATGNRVYDPAALARCAENDDDLQLEKDDR